MSYTNVSQRSLYLEEAIWWQRRAAVMWQGMQESPERVTSANQEMVSANYRNARFNLQLAELSKLFLQLQRVEE